MENDATAKDMNETAQSPVQKKEDMGVVYCLLGLLVAVIVILGGLAIMGDDDDDDDDDGDTSLNNKAYVDLLAVHITDELEENEQTVQSMATSPDIVPAFVIGSGADLDQANAVLDLYKDLFNVTVCYLMNETGMTIASSNRNTTGSFVRNNYGFRPYFQDAIGGDLGHYFALGVTSGTRGFYSSYPVKDENGTIVGVAVIKKELDYIEDAFSSDSITYLVSPEGIIFLSSDPEVLMKSLWKLDQTVIDGLVTSREFGDGPFENLLTDEPVNGEQVTYGGEDYLISRKQINDTGWTIVVLGSTGQDDDDD